MRKVKCYCHRSKGAVRGEFVFAVFSILMCLFVIARRVYCLRGEQRKTEIKTTKTQKFRWLKVRWEQNGTLPFISLSLVSHSFSAAPVHPSELPLGALTLSANSFTYSCCLEVTNFSCPFLSRHVTVTAPGLLSELKVTGTVAWGGEAHREGKGGSRRTVWLHKNGWLKAWFEIIIIQKYKRAGSYLPRELPCLGKQALALARRETCQGLICVFVHRRARKHTRTSSHDRQEKAVRETKALSLNHNCLMHYKCILMYS